MEEKEEEGCFLPEMVLCWICTHPCPVAPRTSPSSGIHRDLCPIPAQGRSPDGHKSPVLSLHLSAHQGNSEFGGWSPGGLQRAVGRILPLSPSLCCLGLPPCPFASRTPPSPLHAHPAPAPGAERRMERGAVQPTLGTGPPSCRGGCPQAAWLCHRWLRSGQGRAVAQLPLCRLPAMGATHPQLLVLYGNPMDQDGRKHRKGSPVDGIASWAQIQTSPEEEGEEPAFHRWGVGGRRGGPSRRANPCRSIALCAQLPAHLHRECGSPWSLLSPAFPKACYWARKSVKI